MASSEIDCGEPSDTDECIRDTFSSADDGPNRSKAKDESCEAKSLALNLPHILGNEDGDKNLQAKTILLSGDAAKYQVLGNESTAKSETAPEEVVLPAALQFSSSGIVSGGSDNKNTHRKTGADLRILGTYMASLNERRPPDAIPPAELNKYLSSFFLVVRKTDGSEYEPCSLRAMLASIERYLRQMNYPASLTRDKEFTDMRNVLKMKQQMLRSLGKGQKTALDASPSASNQEEKISYLFQSQDMGPYNPNSLIFSLCLFVCLHLKLKKSTEHKKLLWGDITLCQDDGGREYLSFTPQLLNKHTSHRLKQMLANARVWSELHNPVKDPVSLYKLYSQKRPQAMNRPDAPFYLGLNINSPLSSQTWYRPVALGTNKLNEMVRQVRDLTCVKTASDACQLQWPAPTIPNDIPPPISDLSNAESELSSATSSSKDDHNLESAEPYEREIFSMDSPRLVIDTDDSQTAHMPSVSSTSDQPLPLVKESDSSDDQSVKSAVVESTDKKSSALPSPSASFGHIHAGEDFQQKIASAHVSKISGLIAQMSEEPVSDEEEEDGEFIGVEQAKELVTDIIRRMDIMDMVLFDHWLKSMKLGRDSFSGEIICRDPKPGGGNSSKSTQFQRQGDNKDNSDSNSMNVFLNISLNPAALSGKAPVTVQATTVKAADLGPVPSFPCWQEEQSSAGAQCGWSADKTESNSPLNLALHSLHSRAGAIGEAHPWSCTSSSSPSHRQPSSSGAAGHCSPTKQKRLTNASSSSPSSQSCPSAVGAAVTTGQRSGGQGEGRRRKRNPSCLTRIKPRTLELDTERSRGEASGLTLTLGAENQMLVEEPHHALVLNLKQEVE